MMNKHVCYIHGLGSDAQSKKYQQLKSALPATLTVECLQWENHDNISTLLEHTATRLQQYSYVVLIGDSTGGNFAYQLRDLLQPHVSKTTLILLNPLLDLDRRIATFAFPDNLATYLKQITHPKNTYIFISQNDEIIDHQWLLQQSLPTITCYTYHDTHRFIDFQNCLPRIQSIIAK